MGKGLVGDLGQAPWDEPCYGCMLFRSLSVSVWFRCLRLGFSLTFSLPPRGLVLFALLSAFLDIDFVKCCCGGRPG